MKFYLFAIPIAFCSPLRGTWAISNLKTGEANHQSIEFLLTHVMVSRTVQPLNQNVPKCWWHVYMPICQQIADHRVHICQAPQIRTGHGSQEGWHRRSTKSLPREIGVGWLNMIEPQHTTQPFFHAIPDLVSKSPWSHHRMSKQGWAVRGTMKYSHRGAKTSLKHPK